MMKRNLVKMVIVTLLACSGAELAQHARLLIALENAYADFWHQMSGIRRLPEKTVILSIDDQALLARKNEPLAFWSPYIARAIEVMRNAGAAMIGIDMIFAINAETFLKTLDGAGTDKSRMYDAPLRAQLNAGQVVLAGLLAQNAQQAWELRTSLNEYVLLLPNQLADVGLVNMTPDVDGVVRHFSPAFFNDSTGAGLGFATLLALKSSNLDPQSTAWTLRDVDIPHAELPRRIGFIGPPGTIPRLSFASTFSSTEAAAPAMQALKGKIVIIAEEATGSQDLHLTPYSRALPGHPGQLMSGPELHANIIETLLSGQFPRPISAWARLLFLSLFSVLITVLLFNVSPWKGLAVAALFSILTFWPAYLLFQADWLLPAAHAQFAAALAYLMTLGFRLTGEERERLRVRQIFGRFVSEEVVEHLVSSGVHPNLGGDTYSITVLFSDIRNFTTISEQLTASEVVEMLNTYFSRACEPILAQGGTVNKFIGDAIMAVFGAPAAFPDHHLRAIHAALEMQRIAAEFQDWMTRRFSQHRLPEFRIGIGIHSGDAVVGNIGSTKRMEYTAIGDTVNTASRLESASKDLRWTIVASAAALNGLAEFVQTNGHDNIHVKGRAQAVEVFEVVGVLPAGAQTLVC